MGSRGVGRWAGWGARCARPGDGPARFAYADPPYIGQAALYRAENPDAAEVDHFELIARLRREFPDGWALSCSVPSLRILLPWSPPDARVCAWVKTFASPKPGVDVLSAWEPVILCGGRPRPRLSTQRARDWTLANPRMGARSDDGFPGRKPPEFCAWVFSLLNARPGDEMVDVFPGSGAVGRAWESWLRQVRIERPDDDGAQLELHGGDDA